MNSKRRVAIYARVSTHDKGQDPETQLRQLRDYAKRRGLRVVGEYVDRGSGRSEERRAYQQLLEAARKRRIDVVLVWRYDRYARSTQALVNSLIELRSLGVDFINSTRTWTRRHRRAVCFLRSSPVSLSSKARSSATA